MKKILLSGALIALWFNLQIVWAACPTGYACLLRDVKNQDSVIRHVQREKVDEYYKLKIFEPKNKSNDKDFIPPYKELIPFSPKYY